MSGPVENTEKAGLSPSNETAGTSSNPKSSPEQSIDVSPPSYGGGALTQGGHHNPYHQQMSMQHQHQVAGAYPAYMSQTNYASAFPPPSSPTAMHHPYAHSMIDVGNAYGQDSPQRSMSPGGTPMDTYSEPYFVPYMQQGGAPAPRYFVPQSGPPHPSSYAQSQYQSGMYGMQYYAPYTQPQYYNTGRPSGWGGANPVAQHGWRQPYYQYQTPPPPHSAPSYGRGGGPRPRPNQGSLSAASRSASTSSRTSPGSSTLPQKQGPSPNSGQSTSDVNSVSGSSSTRISPPQSQGQGPRSEHVLWCGNVPADATADELWAFFTSDAGGAKVGQADVDAQASPNAHGVVSIFIISRSNCAFVNYETDAHLQLALVRFQGKSLRPEDLRCPKLVCRVRKKDDEAQAGVAGQRGRGIHVAWLKEQERRAKEESMALHKQAETPDLAAPQPLRTTRGLSLDQTASPQVVGALQQAAIYSPDSSTATPTPQNNVASYSSAARPSIDNSSSSGSVSYASTNSSLLRNPAFRERFFILKSLRAEDLDDSVKNGTWATQTHNEAVLDQAYRNSESVYLIFSANQSGGFYGYARMASAIHTPDRTAATNRPSAIPEHDESEDSAGPTAAKLGLPAQDFDLSTASPLQMTPSEIDEEPVLALRGGATSEGSRADEGGAEKRSKSTIKPEDIPKRGTSANDEKIGADSSFRGMSTVLSSVSEGSVPALVEEPSSASSDKLTTSSNDESGLPSAQLTQRTSLGSTSSEPMRRAPGVQSPSSSDAASLAPSESASYPADARAQGQLAIRALIHNLRLDEKESYHRAKQLEAVEADMKASEASGLSSEEVKAPQPLASSPATWGKSFKIEWIKVQPLDFQRARRLRNPWRDNRQIKVSRDGTELEPNVGRQLLDEWQKAEDEVQQRRLESSTTGQRGGGGGGGSASSVADEDEDEH